MDEILNRGLLLWEDNDCVVVELSGHDVRDLAGIVLSTAENLTDAEKDNIQKTIFLMMRGDIAGASVKVRCFKNTVVVANEREIEDEKKD